MDTDISAFLGDRQSICITFFALINVSNKEADAFLYFDGVEK